VRFKSVHSETNPGIFTGAENFLGKLIFGHRAEVDHLVAGRRIEVLISGILATILLIYRFLNGILREATKPA
jgi:hypothetical protein